MAAGMAATWPIAAKPEKNELVGRLVRFIHVHTRREGRT